MVWIILGIFLTEFVGLAALVRSLRLEGLQKTLLTIFSAISMTLPVVTLVAALSPALSDTFMKVFFYVGLGVSIVTLAVAVHLLRKKHNKVFTDKTKEHHEHVAELLAKEQEESNK